MARSRDDSLLLRKIKLTLIENKHVLRSYIRQSRALRIFTQLCWLTASTMLNEKDDLKDDLYGEYARLITTQQSTRNLGQKSRSRSPITPTHGQTRQTQLNPALVTSVLN